MRSAASVTRATGVRTGHLLNRAKIMLNISRYPGQLTGKRLILGMANKTLVVSEPMYLSEPYKSGQHYVDCDRRDARR